MTMTQTERDAYFEYEDENVTELGTDIEMAQANTVDYIVKMAPALDDEPLNKLIGWMAETISEAFYSRTSSFDDDDIKWINQAHEKVLRDELRDKLPGRNIEA